MFLIDRLHQHGIGVILDWVPAHFPTRRARPRLLRRHASLRTRRPPPGDPSRLGQLRLQLRAPRGAQLPALERDVLARDVPCRRAPRRCCRFDALPRLLAQARASGSPTSSGGRENLDAIDLLRRFNEEVYQRHPDALTIAEESTAWPMVSRPTYVGGLGFGYKWDMGWMHDTLRYMSPRSDPPAVSTTTSSPSACSTRSTRTSCCRSRTTRWCTGRARCSSKMPGDAWQKLANLRLLLGYMYAQPGKKLLFMGGEIGQWREWSHERSLDWHLLEDPAHRGLQRWVRDLNTLLPRRARAARTRLRLQRASPGSTATMRSRARSRFCAEVEIRTRRSRSSVTSRPCPRHNHRLGVPWGGSWTEILNGDAPLYGGSGQGNLGSVEATPVAWHGRPRSIVVTLPPLAMIVFKGAQSHSH